MVQAGATFGDAVQEWLRCLEHGRGRKPSALSGYRLIVGLELLPRFGACPLDAITTEGFQGWLDAMAQSAGTRRRALVMVHGVFQRARKVWSLLSNPAAVVEWPPLTRLGDLQVCSPEEVWALVCAVDFEADAALYLAAAFTGLRMGELLARRWRDVDFAGSAVRVRASYYAGDLTTPKSGKVGAVPLAPNVATALAQLGHREHFIDDEDLVFGGETGSSTGRRCGVAARRRWPRRDCGRYGSTSCVTCSERG